MAEIHQVTINHIISVYVSENPFVQNVQNVMQMTQGTNAFGAPAWGQVVPPPSGNMLCSVIKDSN